MARSTVAVKFTGDASSLKGSIGQVESKLGGLGKAATTAGKVVAVGLGAAAIGGVALGKQVLDLGAKLTAWRLKTATVFEGSAQDIREWADKNNEVFGLTDDELAGLAASFGDLLKPMGFTADQAASMAKDVVGLSGALSEWSGGTRTAAEVSQILSKAMLGERDGLKELGISITEADVSARLATKGQEKLTGAALEQAKALVTQELIFEKSTDAQKAYTAGGNKALRASNKLKAGFAELKERIAGGLLPVVIDLAEAFGKKVMPILSEVGGAIVAFVGAFLHAEDGITSSGLPGFMERVAITARGVFDVLVQKGGEAFRAIKGWIDDVGPAIKSWVDNVLGDMSKWWDDHGPTVVAVVESIGDAIVDLVEGVKNSVQVIVRNWDQFKYVAGVMAAVITTHYVRLGVEATISAAKQAAAWVVAKTEAIRATVVLIAKIGIQIAQWALLAAKAAFHAAAIAASWVVTTLAAGRADAKMVTSATIQGGAWAGLAASAETNSARIAKAWLAALGPAAAVIAAADAINKIVGSKEGDPAAGNSLWDNLTRNPFDGMDFDIPFFASGGVMPGPRGQHSLAMVAGGETILPTHRSGGVAAPQIIQVVLDGRVLGEVLANRAAVDNRNRAA